MHFCFDDHWTKLHKANLSNDWTDMSCPNASASVMALLPLYFMVPCILKIVRYGTAVQTMEIRA